VINIQKALLILLKNPVRHMKVWTPCIIYNINDIKGEHVLTEERLYDIIQWFERNGEVHYGRDK
jgi:hypothetical protein